MMRSSRSRTSASICSVHIIAVTCGGICYRQDGLKVERIAMKSFLAACAVAVIIAVIGGVALEGAQQTAEHAFNETGAAL